MLVAVLSDSHDHIANLRRAAALADERGATALIHCGDLVAPFMLRELAAFPGPVHVVLGNNDGDVLLLSQVAQGLANVRLHGLLGELEVEGRRLAFTHTERLARPLAASGLYHAVFFGHSHVAHIERLGECLLVNPGDVMGKDAHPSFALFETAANSAEIVAFAHAGNP